MGGVMEVVSVFGGYLRVFPLQYRALKYHLLQNESSDTKKKKRKKNGGLGWSPLHSQALGASVSDDTSQRAAEIVLLLL